MQASPTKRARADADKHQRRQDILRAASQAFADQPFAAVTMADVAQRAGLAKGTVYLYYTTKEALFLHLVTEALDAWFVEVAEALTRERAQLGPEALAELLVRTLAAREELTRLLSILHPVLEQNIADELALGFKQRLREQTAAAGEHIERRFLDFAPGDGVRFLLRLHAVTIGLHAMARPSPSVARILARPELAALRVDFAAELQAVVAALLRGWRSPAT